MADDIDGKKINIGDEVEDMVSHHRHTVINMTNTLLTYKDKSGNVKYRRSTNFKKVEDEWQDQM